MIITNFIKCSFFVLFFFHHLGAHAQGEKVDSIESKRYLQLGLEKLKLNSAAEALVYFESSISKDAKNWVALRYTGDVLRKQKEYQQAEKYYTLALEINPNDTSSLKGRADVERLTNKFTEAIEDYSKLIRYGSRNGNVYFGRGLCFSDKKKYEEALSDYNYALTIFPKSKEIYFARGLLFYNRNKFNNSIADFSNSLKFGLEKKLKARFYRGMAYYFHKKLIVQLLT